MALLSLVKLSIYICMPEKKVLFTENGSLTEPSMNYVLYPLRAPKKNQHSTWREACNDDPVHFW